MEIYAERTKSPPVFSPSFEDRFEHQASDRLVVFVFRPFARIIAYLAFCAPSDDADIVLGNVHPIEGAAVALDNHFAGPIGFLRFQYRRKADNEIHPRKQAFSAFLAVEAAYLPGSIADALSPGRRRDELGGHFCLSCSVWHICLLSCQRANVTILLIF